MNVYPLLAEYGVGLRWADLKHLVLSDRAAVDAGEALAKFSLLLWQDSRLCYICKAGR